jgi:hypothetical protein
MWRILRIACVLACFVCAGHSRRVPATSERSQANLRKERWQGLGTSKQQHVVSHPLKALAMSLLDVGKDPDEDSEFDDAEDYWSDLVSQFGNSEFAGEEISNTSEEFTDTYDDFSYMDFEKMGVVETLKADILKILRTEPTLSIFAEGFKVLDQTGAKIQGMDRIVLLFKLVRSIHRKFGIRDFQVNFIEKRWVETLHGKGRKKEEYHEPSDQFLWARWKVKLGGRSGFFRFWRKEIPIVIEADTLFHLDGRNKVDSMRVDKWLLNGREIRLGNGQMFWPDVMLSNDPADDAENTESIHRWMSAVKGVSELNQRDVNYLMELPRFPASELEGAVSVFKRDIPRFLFKDPTWKIFSREFQLHDLITGATVAGLEDCKMRLTLLRKLIKKLGVRNHYVHITEMNWVESWFRNGKLRWTSSEPFQPYVQVRWKLELGARGQWRTKPPVEIEAATIFHIDNQTKVDYAQLQELSINGVAMSSDGMWPQVDFSEPHDWNLAKIEDWLKASNEDSV